MLRVDLHRAPRWYDIVEGVRFRMLPLTSTLLAEIRSAPEQEAAEPDVPHDVRVVILAKAVARAVIVEWDGVGDADGVPVEPSPEAIDAVLEVKPVFDAFQAGFVGPHLLWVAEKNGCAPSPNGASEGDTPIALPAKGTVPTAPGG